MKRQALLSALGVLVLGVGLFAGIRAADGDDDSSSNDGARCATESCEEPGDPAGGIEPAPDDAGGSQLADGEEFPSETARQDAQALLGQHEENLPEYVRIARRGGEQFALTEDYELGRLTVELDDDGSGYRVVRVTVELPEDPESFDLQPS